MAVEPVIDAVHGSAEVGRGLLQGFLSLLMIDIAPITAFKYQHLYCIL